MRILLVGAGGVGTAFARIAARRAFAELVIADYDLGRAQRAAAARDGYQAVQLDARDEQAAAGLLRQHRCDVLMNATDPRFVMPLFRAALQAGMHYLDMAMSLSYPHPDEPYRQTGVKLGDEQFALAPEWERSGRLALVGMGVEPGLSDVFARYAADELFGEIAELGVRDGANLEVAGYEFAPTFSIWTTIEECLNPPVIWERGRGWFTTEPFSEPEVFTFPAGIGPVECVNVEHEEVLLMPRWVEAQRVTFKYGLGAEFIGVLRTLHKLGLDSTDPVRVGGASVSPRDVVAACLPDPAGLGDKMSGLTCAGTWVTGTGADGAPREVYLYHVVDNAWSMAEYGSQAVVWQTAVNPVVALELIDSGAWSGAGVLGPEALPPRPFLDLLTDYGSPWAARGAHPRLDVGEDLLEHLGGVRHRLGLEAELLHDLQVAVHLDRLVQVERAGQLLDVDDVLQVRLGEPEDAERSAHGRVRTGAERQDLQCHRRVIHHLGEVLQLLADDFPAADRAAKRALVDHDPELRRVGPAQDLLAAGPQLAPPRDLFLGFRGALADQGAGVAFGLQQPRHELDLVGPDDRRGRLQAHVGLQPGGEDVGIGVPPARGVRFPGEVQQGGALLAVGDTVEGKEVAHIALLEADPAMFHPADLGVRAADGFRGLLSGNSPRLAQPVQLAAEHQPLDGRTARARAKNAGGNIPGRVFRRDHRHSSHRRTLRSWRGVDQSPM